MSQIVEKEFICMYWEGDSTKIDYKKTGARIKALCDKKGVSVKDIQDKLCIGAFQSIYNWFRGKTMPNVDNLFALSRLLGVALDELIISEAVMRTCVVHVNNFDRNKHVQYQNRIEAYKKYLAAV